MLSRWPYFTTMRAFCHKTNRFLLLFVALTLALSGGCTSFGDYVHNGFKVGPNYQKPPAPVANEWIDSKSKGVNTACADLTDWWSVFNDPVLNSLVDQAYRQNLDVRTAGTHILRCRGRARIAAGNMFPQLQDAVASYSHNAVSGTVANAATTDIVRFFDNNGVGLNLAWEIDFWGRFRRAVEAADAQLDASIENYDDVLVLLISDVASNYVQIRVFQQRLKFVNDNIVIQTELVRQAEDRLKGSAGRMIDQARGCAPICARHAQLLGKQLDIGLRLANNRLCVLLGIPVREFGMPELGNGSVPTTPPEVAVGMPTELLRRRPDVRRAERLVAAQSARIGIATADLYPRFTLLGSIGYAAQDFGDLFNSKSFVGSIGPSMQWDILNYGRLLNGIRVQDAQFQTTVLDYQNAVLHAGREVEDGIVLFLRAQTQTRQLADSAKEARIAAEEAVVLSKDVKFDLNRAFVTTNFLVAQQDKLAVASGDIAQGLIQVYKALGGGWQIRCSPQEVIPDGPAPKQIPQPQPQQDSPAVRPVPQPQVVPNARAHLLPPLMDPAPASNGLVPLGSVRSP